MPRSEKAALKESIRRLYGEADRFHDLACVVDVYRRHANDSITSPLDPVVDSTIPWRWGGRWDRRVGRYTGEPEKVSRLKLHVGQARMLEFFDRPVRKVMGLGAPGGGKSLNIVVLALLYGLWNPVSIVGVVAPTRDRLKRTVWKKFLQFAPPEWIREVRDGDMEIVLHNGTVYQFVATRRASKDGGSPIAGLDWHAAFVDEQQNIDDESMREIEARGRVNLDYQIFSSATNESAQGFQGRIRAYEAAEDSVVLRFTGTDNCFTPLAHWEWLRTSGQWSKEDFDRIVRCLDIPRSGRAYPEFSYTDGNIRPYPRLGKDITEALTYRLYEKKYRFVVGIDFGVRINSCHVLSAVQIGEADKAWWARDEFVSERGLEWLVKAIREKYDVKQCIFVSDPQGRSQKVEGKNESYHTTLQNLGCDVVGASHRVIAIEHRLRMVNALLCDSAGVRRLYVDCDEKTGKEKCPKLVESFSDLMLGANDKPDARRKDPRFDLTHYTDDVGYGLFPFESFRGTAAIQALTQSGRVIQ